MLFSLFHCKELISSEGLIMILPFRFYPTVFGYKHGFEPNAYKTNARLRNADAPYFVLYSDRNSKQLKHKYYCNYNNDHSRSGKHQEGDHRQWLA